MEEIIEKELVDDQTENIFALERIEDFPKMGCNYTSGSTKCNSPIDPGQ